MAATGQGRALYVCYEHSEEFLLERLIAMESALDGDEAPIGVGDLRNLLAARAEAGAWTGASAGCWLSSGRPSRCCAGWPGTRNGCSWSRRDR